MEEKITKFERDIKSLKGDLKQTQSDARALEQKVTDRIMKDLHVTIEKVMQDKLGDLSAIRQYNENNIFNT